MKPHSYTFFLVIFTASWVQYCASVNLTTLRLAQVVYRHGDRAPMFTYPTDPYNDEEKYWPFGFGQLTTRGMDQQYDLGQYLRERYDGFIDLRYSKKQINVLSSDTDRSLMSAEANLEGLFPKLTILSGANAVKSDEPGGKVETQLVPIHTIPATNDETLYMSARCLRREAAMEEYKESSALLQQIRAENADLMNYVQEQTGLLSDETDIFGFVKAIDVLYCQQQHGLELPSWATSTQFSSNTAGNYTVFEQMRNISAISFSLTGGTDELRRLNGGPLAKRLIDNMVATSNVDNNQQKKQSNMYMHSAHDDTLAAVMNTMGIFEPHNPGYASMLIVDLHQEDSTGKYFVEVFYRNTTERDPYPMHIPGCGSPCYLEDMETALSPYIPTNWSEECLRQPGTTSGKLTYSASGPDQITVYHHYQFSLTALLYFLAVIVISITVWVTILCLVSRRRRASINDSDYPGYDKGAYVKIP